MKTADDREGVLFREALQRAKGPEREACLSQACAGNEALRGRLEALLQAQESPEPWLEAPAALPASTIAGEILDSLAKLYQDWGRTTEAQACCQRALKLYEKTHGPNYPDTVGRRERLAEMSFEPVSRR